MTMTWALAGQILVCWIVLSFAFAPLIGRYLHNRRINQDFRRELKLVLNREALIVASKADIKRATDLGFREDFESNPFALDDPWEGTPFARDDESDTRPAA